MTTSLVEFPNIRKLFVPDQGHIIFDADLAGADAQVVAWEADDEDLKKGFRAGIDVHAMNAEMMWGAAFTRHPKDSPAWNKMRKRTKGGVHGTNYGASARTLSVNLGGTIHEWDQFQKKWFSLHPGIKEWHRRVDSSLRATRSVENAFGYRIVYFDRIDSCFTQALAWIPQSTVALTCFRGALQLEEKYPEVEMLLQVHDSLVFQVRKWAARDTQEYVDALKNPVPYPDPLVIGWGIKSSEKSWGDCG